MKRAFTKVAAALILACASLPVLAEDTLELVIADVVGDPESVGTPIVTTDVGGILEAVVLGGGRRYRFAIHWEPEEIAQRLRVTWRNVQPDSSQIPAMDLLVPYNVRGVLRIVVQPPAEHPDLTPPAVESLFRTRADRISEEALFERLHRARGIAAGRTSSFQESPSDAHPLDVQATYKFLEAAVAISRSLRIQPPSITVAARDWLSDVNIVAPRAVKKASVPAIDEMVNAFDSLDGGFLTGIWRSFGHSDCSATEPRLKSFKAMVNDLGDEAARRRVFAVLVIDAWHIESALAACLSKSFMRASRSITEEEADKFRSELRSRIEAIELELGNLSEGSDGQRRLQSDRTVLMELDASLEATLQTVAHNP